LKKILVVDDESAIVDLVSFMLSGPFKIITAKDGREAVEKFKVFRPEIVIMDVMMPIMNGIEAIKIMKSIDPETKIVALTAYADKKGEELKSVGVEAVIEKPFKKRELVYTIKNLL